DGDSFIESLGSTQSLSSSIFHYRKEHGRTYSNFKDTEYWQPNDDKQNNGLDLHHHMMLQIHDNKLFRAPLKDPQNVLDVGTGTGIWAIDFAEQFPACTVTGTDLSPIQPTWVPPNCKFELDDATQAWTFPDNSLDFIHMRFLLGSIEDWVGLFKEAYRCLKPGGWIEHTDFTIRISCDDGSLPDDCIYYTWNRMFAEAGEKTKRTFLVTDKDQNAGWIKEAGFSSVNISRYKAPLGTWPAEKKWKNIGAFNLATCQEGLEGYILYLGTNVLGWELEELQVVIAKMRQALKNPSYHATYPV
ncbi:S-adenosyl-L-methionine-dependent methyltransferase, partial [Schizothecium vesticola]